MRIFECDINPINNLQSPHCPRERGNSIHLAVVRKVLTPGVWKSVVNLPAQLMREARAKLPDAPNVNGAKVARLGATGQTLPTGDAR